MEMKIENYMHLYLGCNIFYPETNEYSVLDWTHLLDLFTSRKRKEEYNAPFVLVLRPISSMTEGEAIKVASLSEMEEHFRDVKVTKSKFDDLIVSWDGMGETREEFNATDELFYCPEQFQYLLLNHFDVFDIINTGIAIDSTKQTPAQSAES